MSNVHILLCEMTDETEKWALRALAYEQALREIQNDVKLFYAHGTITVVNKDILTSIENTLRAALDKPMERK